MVFLCYLHLTDEVKIQVIDHHLVLQRDKILVVLDARDVVDLGNFEAVVHTEHIVILLGNEVFKQVGFTTLANVG